MKVWILQTGEPLQIDAGGLRPMRAINLSNALIEHGHQVILWSSDFDHFSKKKRTGKNSVIQYSPNLEIRLISSRGYKSHVGLSRLFDHAQLACNLRREIKKQPLPDVAFIGYPPIETAWVMTNWLSRHKIPTLLDVKDAWPHVLLRAIPSKLQIVARFALLPYFVIAKQTFKKSTALSSISPPFLEWCLNFTKRKSEKFDLVIPLTAPTTISTKKMRESAASWWDEQNLKNDETFKACFVGTISSGFNFRPVLEAAKKTGIRMIIAGDGSKLESLKNEAAEARNISFPGWIDTIKSEILFERSTIMIAPIIDSHDFMMSIPNKFYDAMKYGIPIVSSIQGYGRDIIESNHLGFCYGNEQELIEIITKLRQDRKLVDEISKNELKYFEKNFSFEKVYHKLTNNLNEMRLNSSKSYPNS